MKRRWYVTTFWFFEITTGSCPVMFFTGNVLLRGHCILPRYENINKTKISLLVTDKMMVTEQSRSLVRKKTKYWGVKQKL